VQIRDNQKTKPVTINLFSKISDDENLLLSSKKNIDETESGGNDGNCIIENNEKEDDSKKIILNRDNIIMTESDGEGEFLKTLVHIEDNTTLESDDEKDASKVSDNDYFENWKGKGQEVHANPTLKFSATKKRKRNTKYMDNIPEIEKILSIRNLRSNNTTLLINGNTTTHTHQ